jgi:tRNA (guanosine-2'-O-)-methyltransferase
MTPARFALIKSVLARRQPDLTVVMDGVHKPHNLNAIIRSCDAVGVLKAHYVPVEGGYEPLNHYAKGSQKWVGTEEHRSFAEAAKTLKQQGHQLLAAHLSDQAVDYREVDYTRPTAIVLGEELRGISDTTAAAVDGHILIPMLGMVESLNVSVAAAVILFEAQKQRLAKGLYDQCRLDAETYQRLLFEWAWPDLARRCRQQGQPYPPLDEEGNLLNPKPINLPG